ncbi:hypothetical protein WICMUC_004085 [Wickerhamomyces mucosus]|uniref:Zn(2)-C6 fungal-type domain-containing protein n=1 Tax=Wickerhamomyces mucosus TaxID=1378264 RepID=A0A9P8PIH8_9ASCO|nr:hypothetical protein WICMUC_004085 [Wickerhamomyces mucosus]
MSNQPKKARIRKACDLCHQKRVKCSGGLPCASCGLIKVECTYNRDEKKRGRASDNYPKEIRKRKSKIILESKKQDILRLVLNASPHKDFVLGSTKYQNIQTISDDLQYLGIPFEVADELYQFYFDDQYFPVSKAFTVLRRNAMLNGTRLIKKSLVLVILLSSALQSDNRFFLGSSREYYCQAMYRMIQEKLPDNHNFFEFDDFIVLVHFAYLMPWLSYPIDSAYWWEFSVEIAHKLQLNNEDIYLDEEKKEERRRGWWSLYLLDRSVGLAFNMASKITDSSCYNMYLPCDETLWSTTSNPIKPAHLDPSRQKFIDYDKVSDGLYGWFIPICGIFGKYIEFRSEINQIKKIHLKQQLKEIQNRNLNAIQKYQSEIPYIESSIRQGTAKLDMYYARYINLALTFVVESEERSHTFGELSNGMSQDQFEKLSDCIDILQEIAKTDVHFQRYPYIIGVYLFSVGVSVLSITNDINEINQETVTKINKFKYLVNILVRVIELDILLFPAEFLKIIRNYLIWAVKDCDNLILLSDYMDQFKANTIKRQDTLRAFSWAAGGHGIAV